MDLQRTRIFPILGRDVAEEERNFNAGARDPDGERRVNDERLRDGEASSDSNSYCTFGSGTELVHAEFGLLKSLGDHCRKVVLVDRVQSLEPGDVDLLIQVDHGKLHVRVPVDTAGQVVIGRQI